MTHKVTPRIENFNEWYQDVIAAAELAEHSGVKGSMIIKPEGYAIWERIQTILDREIKATGHRNAYFPLFIPEEYLKREATHIEGFAPELAVVTRAGGEELKEPLVVRPTSETMIHAAFARWIQSWRDLPILVNQWANVVRWELRPRLFLRTTEFLWQEGHTAHATEAEAEAETLKMLKVYELFARDVLAMPVVSGQKTDAERFAGAKLTYTIEALMQDGRALQAGTSHNLGQNFSKVFDVGFADQEGRRQLAWLTSWGVSTRLIGGLIMTHSDDKGLVLPPRVASRKAVIIPIAKTPEEQHGVMALIRCFIDEIHFEAWEIELDDRDYLTPGAKFHEWERKGVPLRIEIGPRDVAEQRCVIVRRDTGTKEFVKIHEIGERLPVILDDMQQAMLERAEARLEAMTFEPASYDEFTSQIAATGGFFVAGWCGTSECELKIKDETKATIRCILFDQPKKLGKCLKCEEKATYQVIYARAY